MNLANHYTHAKGTTHEQLQEQKNRRKKDICELVLNSKNGVTTKELCVDLKIPSNSVRRYLQELIDEGQIVTNGKAGKALIYIYKDGEVMEAQKPIVEQLPIWPGGREFTEVKPAINVNQGDVVWVSSRSGDGEFFRYLVITPWARKATVVGIVPEGHPVLDLNDTRFVYVGDDPETNQKLYADISNTCSRGYAQFGEKLMKIGADEMNEIKTTISRYYRMNLPKSSSQSGDILKAQAETKAWKGKCEELRDDVQEWKGKCASLGQQLNEKDKLLNESLRTSNESLDMAERLKNELAESTKTVNQLTEACTRLQEQNKTLEEALAEATAEPEPVMSADMDALLWKISLLEKELEGKNEMITVLKQITFKSLKGGE